MKEQKLKILVSQPSRQYVHHLCLALQRSRRWQAMYTSLWYRPDYFPFTLLKFFPSALKQKLEYFLKKRFHPELDQARIHLFPWAELFRIFLRSLPGGRSERWTLYMERIHDHYVARKLQRNKPDIVIAYEKSCLRTFMQAKKPGMISVLDLAQVHYEHIAELRLRFPVFKEMMDERLFHQINRVKAAEYQQADYILTLSSYARETMIRAGIGAEKIFTVNLGFDPLKFAPKTVYTKEGRFRILFVGTLTRRKGLHLLLEAFRQLAFDDAELVLIGPVDDAQDILDKFVGTFQSYPFMHHEELAEQYRQADLFVFPSLLDSWAMTVIEAMASGTPVIVSEHTGAKDAVMQGGGKVIPAGDLQALKENIQFFYENRTILNTYGRRAREVALAYTWENYYDQIEQIIQEIYARENKTKDIDIV